MPPEYNECEPNELLKMVNDEATPNSDNAATGFEELLKARIEYRPRPPRAKATGLHSNAP